MTFVELHEMYLAKVEALNAHPTGEGGVHKAWIRVYERLLDRPPPLRTKADALIALAFLEHEMVDVCASTQFEPLLKRLRTYIEGRAA